MKKPKPSIREFFSNIVRETLRNGKTLIGYALLQVPFLNDYPMMLGMLVEFYANPTAENFAKVSAQAVLLFGVTARAIRIILAARSGLVAVKGN